MDPKAIGTFRRRGPYIFRTEARLQWGNSNDPLGLIIMLNPGSSRLEDPHRWAKYLNGLIDPDVFDEELYLDPTMQVVRRIMEKSHPCLMGTLEIKNLFNLRVDPAKAKPSIEKYNIVRKEEIYNDLLHSEFREDEVKKFPWIWLGWTIEKNERLDQRRNQVLKAIPFGKQKFVLHSRQLKLQKYGDLYIRHPFEPGYEEEMVELMNEYWAKKA